MSDLTRSTRPLGLGSDLARIGAAVAIGLVLLGCYWVGLPWAFTIALRSGLG